jgi:hypothetical protein
MRARPPPAGPAAGPRRPRPRPGARPRRGSRRWRRGAAARRTRWRAGWCRRGRTPAPGAGIRRGAPPHGQRPPLAPLLSRDDAEEGRLPGAVGAHEPHLLALVHGERHAVEHGAGAVRLPEVLRVENVHRVCSRRIIRAHVRYAATALYSRRHDTTVPARTEPRQTAGGSPPFGSRSLARGVGADRGTRAAAGSPLPRPLLQTPRLPRIPTGGTGGSPVGREGGLSVVRAGGFNHLRGLRVSALRSHDRLRGAEV